MTHVDREGALPESLTLTSREAAVVRTWARTFTIAAGRSRSGSLVRTDGIRGVADSIGLSREHLSRCLSPRQDRRKAIGTDPLVSLFGLLARDPEAAYDLRRCADDDVQRCLDAAVKRESFGQIVGDRAPKTSGIIVAVLPLPTYR